ncbi:MAG: TetR/AcrR family transcriptional regulator, partial [Henriciella sp.]
MSTATPAERRKENIRRRILQAADEMLALEGASGLSIRRLAEITDYSPAAIYRYFPSKESLVEELKEAFFARLVDNLSASVDQSIPF